MRTRWRGGGQKAERGRGRKSSGDVKGRREDVNFDAGLCVFFPFFCNHPQLPAACHSPPLLSSPLPSSPCSPLPQRQARMRLSSPTPQPAVQSPRLKSHLRLFSAPSVILPFLLCPPCLISRPRLLPALLQLQPRLPQTPSLSPSPFPPVILRPSGLAGRASWSHLPPARRNGEATRRFHLPHCCPVTEELASGLGLGGGTQSGPLWWWCGRLF